MKITQKGLKNLLILAILLVLAIGSTVTVSTYHSAQSELINAHDNHLIDLAHSVDQNLDNLLTVYRQVLSETIKNESFLKAEQRWMASGDSSAISYTMSHNPIAESSGIASMLAIYSSHYKTTKQGDEHTYIFPYKNYYENIWLCQDETGSSYLAIMQPSDDYPIRYAALIDLNTLYDFLVGEELRGDYAVQFFDSTSRLLMYNDKMDLQALRTSFSDENREPDGASVLINAEKSETPCVDSYSKKDKYGNTSDFRIAVLPTSQNRNGIFGISVSVSYELVYGTIQNLMVQLILSFGIIAISIIFLSILLFRVIRKTQENDVQIQMLQDKNKEMAMLVEKTEQLAHHQRLELIGTMTSSIAHEVNNMLTPIMGYSIMAMEKLPEGDEEVTDYLTEIYNASSRAKQLITRISSLSRQQSEHSFTDLAPDELIFKVMQLAAPSIPQNITVVKQLSAWEHCIHANDLQLQQALLNIIINAIAAMEKGGGTLTITTEMLKDTVVISISDTGCGIPEELIKRIYEPFFTTKEVGKGTGLGLAIAARAMEDHNAVMDVQSKVGEGTTFRLTFPKVDAVSEESSNDQGDNQ